MHRIFVGCNVAYYRVLILVVPNSLWTHWCDINLGMIVAFSWYLFCQNISMKRGAVCFPTQLFKVHLKTIPEENTGQPEF